MKKKTKIKFFFFNPYPAVGGVDTVLKKFINSLDLKYYDVEYITLKPIDKKFNKKITYTNLNQSSTFLSYFEINKKLTQSEHKKKIFFSIQYFSNIWAILFLQKIKNTKTFLYEVNHLDELDNYKNLKEYIKKNIIKFFVKRLYCKADLIAGNSKELSLDLSKFIKAKVHTLYNPCFYGFRKKKTKNTFSKKIKILNIARLDFQKDHLTLLKAINLTKIKNKIQLILVGNGPYKNKIKKFSKLNKIDMKIYTNVTKLDSFYANSDLYISTSLYEGLPTTMVEAASYNLPIISSNFRSGSKEILNNGKSGFIFGIKDYRYLSTLIEKFYDNPKIFIQRKKSLKNSLKKFSFKKNIEVFKKLSFQLSQ